MAGGPGSALLAGASLRLTMSKFTNIIGIAIALLFFVLGFYLLFGERFKYLTKEIRVIFAVFLFLYGTFRIVRYLFKEHDRDEE